MWTSRIKAQKAALARCPQCGGEVTVSPEPHNSRFVAQCRNSKCGHSFSYPVRASALSLPGVLQISATLFCGVAAYLCVRGAGRGLQLAAVLAAVLVGGAIVRFVLRLAAHALLQSSAPLSWKDEMIAYLAPPPFLRRMPEGDITQAAPPNGGPAAPQGNSGATAGPPSVS